MHRRMITHRVDDGAPSIAVPRDACKKRPGGVEKPHRKQHSKKVFPPFHGVVRLTTQTHLQRAARKSFHGSQTTRLPAVRCSAFDTACFIGSSVAPLSCLVVKVIQFSKGFSTAKNRHYGIKGRANVCDIIPICMGHPCLRRVAADLTQCLYRSQKMSRTQPWVICKCALRKFQLGNECVGFQRRMLPSVAERQSSASAVAESKRAPFWATSAAQGASLQ